MQTYGQVSERKLAYPLPCEILVLNTYSGCLLAALATVPVVIEISSSEQLLTTHDVSLTIET